MKLCHPYRLLLPVSGTLVVIPIFFSEQLNGRIFTSIFYFLGIYFFLLNFPRLCEIMNDKPIYIEDLVITTEGDNRHKFKNAYVNIMILVLSILCALFVQYISSRSLYEKPLIEILGIIGGNLILYVKIQNIVGRIFINICHCVKEQHETTTLSRSSSFCERNENNHTVIETDIDEAFSMYP